MYSPETNTELPLETETRPKRFPLGALLLGVLLGWVLLSLFSHTAKVGVWNRLAGAMTGRSTRVDTSTPAVVEKIRQLSRLETVDYSIDKIVEGSRQNPYLPNFLVGDKLMLVAHGDVIAGVDLSQLQAADVAVDGSHVKVRLPQAQLLSTRLDNAHTRVYSRMTGLLVEADPNLESEVRLAAEDQFTRAALADGVLEKARQNARASVSALLRGLGFQSVDVE
jgi:hypothetical protein